MSEFSLPRVVPKSPRRFYALMSAAARDRGVPPWRQMYEIMRYGLIGRQFRVLGYYDTLSPERRDDPAVSARDFVDGRGGWRRINRALRAASNPVTVQLLDDKLLFAVTGKAAGLPIVPCLAFFHPTRAEIGALALRTPAQITSFLRRADQYPMFCKPTALESGLGAASLTAYDSASDSVTLLDGNCAPVERFAEMIARDFAGGYLFQPRLAQHPQVAALCGDTISTVRVVTMVDGGEPQHCYASWKIARPDAMADNSWRPGSISAAIDLSTGRVTRAQSGLGLNGRLVPEHPGTGDPLIGMALPCWVDVLETTARAHRTFSDVHLIGWDVALTPSGPVLIEGNTLPNHLAYQISSGRGALGAEFAALARSVARRRRSARLLGAVPALRRKLAKLSLRLVGAWRSFGPPARFGRS